MHIIIIRKKIVELISACCQSAPDTDLSAKKVISRSHCDHSRSLLLAAGVSSGEVRIADLARPLLSVLIPAYLLFAFTRVLRDS